MTRLRLRVIRAFLPLFVAFSVLYPRTSYAILPIAIPLIMTAVSTTGVETAIVSGAGLAVGAAIAYFVIKNQNNPTEQVRVPAGTASANTVPAPAQGSLSSSTTATTQTCGYWYTTTPTYTATAQSCSSGTPDAWANCAAWGGSNSGGWCCNAGICLESFSSSSQKVCSAGYALQVDNTTCLLTNTRAAVPDSKQDYQRSGQVYSGYTGDDTAPNVKPATTQTTTANDTVQVSTTSGGSGSSPVSVKVTATTTGSVVDYATQKTDANGQVYVHHDITNLDLNGNVTSTSGSNMAQTLNVNVTTGQLDTTAGTASTASPATTQSASFPSDYARTGEATAAAGLINVQLAANASQAHADAQQLHQDLTNTQDVADPTMPDKSGFEDAFFKGTFDGLKNWTLPRHTGTCPTATFDYNLFGHQNHLVMDAQCTIAEQQRATLSVVMIVVWLLVALFIVMGA